MQSDPIKTNTVQWWECRTHDRGGSSGETSTRAEEARLTCSTFPPSASTATGSGRTTSRRFTFPLRLRIFQCSSREPRRSRGFQQAVRTVDSPPPDAWLVKRSWRRSSSSTHTGTSSFQSGFGGELGGWTCLRRPGCSGGRRRVSLLRRRHIDSITINPEK